MQPDDERTAPDGPDEPQPPISAAVSAPVVREPAAEGAAKPPRRRGVRWWVLRGALLVGAALLAFTLASQWHDVSDSVDQLTVAGIALSALITFVAVSCTLLAWRGLLTGLGAHLPLRAATRVFFVGQIGKYIPGSVWPVLAQMELSRDYGVGRAESASASLVVLGLAVPSGGIVAAVTLPFVSTSALSHYGWVLAAIPVFLVLLHPAVLGRLLKIAARVLHRQAPPPLGLRAVVTAAGWLAFGFVLYGIATWFVARDLHPSTSEGRLFALCIGAYALAWTAGFLVIIVPAGAGVREAVLVLALSPALPSGKATLVALVLRLLATIADLLWAGVGLALRPRTPLAMPLPDDEPPSPGAHRANASPGALLR